MRILFSELPFKEGQDIILPYAYGLMRSYVAQMHPEVESRVEWLQPSFLWNELNDLDLRRPDVLALSCYVWNVQTQLRLAEVFKSLRPDGIVICGGPEIEPLGGELAALHPYVDFWVHKEGEEPFARILKSILENGRETSLKNRLSLQTSAKPVALPLKSPYAMGFLDPLADSLGDIEFMALMETTRGCPFNCSFCNWGSYTSSNIRAHDFERVVSDIEWMGKHNVSRLYITDANFGILPRDVQIAEELGRVRRETGSPKLVWTNYNKNTTGRVLEINDILLANKMSYSGATISIQSLNEETLKHISRENIGFKKYLDLDIENKKRNLTSYTELILGLPGETLETFKAGVDRLVQRRVRNIRMYPAVVLKNTDFDRLEYRRKHGLKHRDTKLYVEQHTLFGQEVVERAAIVRETATIRETEMKELYRFSYLTQALYATGFLKQIFDGLPGGSVPFSRFVSSFFERRSAVVAKVSALVNAIVDLQFDTDQTSVFGVQSQSFNFMGRQEQVWSAPWNLIWLELILSKKELLAELREELIERYDVRPSDLEDIFALQDFLHLDLELWNGGRKEVRLESDLLELAGTGPVVYSHTRSAPRTGDSLAEYLHYSTGSNAVTEFKFLIRMDEICATPLEKMVEAHS